MKKSLKKLSLNKQAISRLNALGIKGGGALSPGPTEPGSVVVTGVGATCDPRDSECQCDTDFNCN